LELSRWGGRREGRKEEDGEVNDKGG